MNWLTVSPEEWTALALSLKVGLVAALAALPPGILAGWLLARRQFFGKALLDGLIHAPLLLPPVVTGYLLLVVLGRNGLIGHWLDRWFGFSLPFTWPGAALAGAVVALPLTVRAVRLAIELVDPRLEAAARVLGAGPVRIFFTVTLPLSLGGIISGFVLAFARSLGEFGATITFVGNVEGQTQTLPLAIYSAIQLPGGEGVALKLVGLSVVLCVGSLVVADYLARRAARRLTA